jgi:RNA polymerase sigma factor (sigma-70 family)
MEIDGGLRAPTDAELWTAAGQADEEALTVLWLRHQEKVRRRCRAILRNDADAEEVWNDVLLFLHESTPNCEAPGSVGALLVRVARNKCIDELRRRQREFRHRTVQAADDPATEAAIVHSGPDDPELDELIRKLDNGARRTQVHTTLVTLEPQHQETLIELLWTRHPGSTTAELAEGLNSSEVQEQTRRQEARRKFRAAYLAIDLLHRPDWSPACGLLLKELKAHRWTPDTPITPTWRNRIIKHAFGSASADMTSSDGCPVCRAWLATTRDRVPVIALPMMLLSRWRRAMRHRPTADTSPNDNTVRGADVSVSTTPMGWSIRAVISDLAYSAPRQTGLLAALSTSLSGSVGSPVGTTLAAAVTTAGLLVATLGGSVPAAGAVPRPHPRVSPTTNNATPTPTSAPADRPRTPSVAAGRAPGRDQTAAPVNVPTTSPQVSGQQNPGGHETAQTTSQPATPTTPTRSGPATTKPSTPVSQPPTTPPAVIAPVLAGPAELDFKPTSPGYVMGQQGDTQHYTASLSRSSDSCSPLADPCSIGGFYHMESQRQEGYIRFTVGVSGHQFVLTGFEPNSSLRGRGDMHYTGRAAIPRKGSAAPLVFKGTASATADGVVSTADFTLTITS